MNKDIFLSIWMCGSMLNDSVESYTREMGAKKAALQRSAIYRHLDKFTFWYIAKSFEIWILIAFLFGEWSLRT